MIKTIIVDDEDIIREGICKFIDWNSLGLELVGQAANGREAEELISVASPEIIITDVKMPRMNGLELLALAKEKNPSCIVIMISSYDQFEYAQQSLNLGAFAYLLKPIDTDRLIQVLVEAENQVRQNQSRKLMLDSYRDILEQTQREALENKLKVLVFGGKIEGFTSIEETYLSRFCEYSIIGVYAGEMIFHEEVTRKKLEEKLNDWIDEHNENFEIKHFQNHNKIMIFCILCKNPAKILYQKLYHIYMQYSKTVVLGVSKTVDSIWKIYDAYRQSMEAVEYRFFTETPIIYSHDVQSETKTPLGNMPDWSKRARECIQQKDGGIIPSFLSNFLTYIYEEKLSGVMIRATVSSVLLEMIHVLRDMGGNPEDIFLSVSETITDVLDEKNPEVLVGKLGNALETASTYIGKLEKTNPNSAVYKAKHYIEKNYSNAELRLDDVAGYVYINPSYFSTIFSREMKISFGDYLTKIRIEKAVHLLKSTNYKIYEIAEMVGYQNVSWFNVAFKKYTGKTPGDLRR